MRADSIGAWTGLFAAVALWAVCVWVLALFGLGGRVGPLPEDPGLLQPLPSGLAAAEERLGPLSQYAEIGERPLFTNDRRPRPYFIDPQGEGEEAPAEFDLILTSVLIAPDLQMAIVQPRGGGEPLRVKVGESPRTMPAWSLTSVAPRSAVFAGPEGERTLELRVFDGIGGAPPTPMAPVMRPAEQAASAQGLPAPPPAAVPMRQQRPPLAGPMARDAAMEAEGAAEEISPAAQAEAIRRRIEARRAQLRESAEQSQPPSRPPPPTQ